MLPIIYANPVCVFHPNKVPRLEKSLMVHNIAACISNTSLPYESKVLIPVFHNSFNSSISGCKYTSISFPGARFPGMIMERMNELCSIHIQGGRLYGISTTGQILWLVLRLPYGLNPSVAKPSLTFRGSEANWGCLKSNVFHALESLGCLKMTSFVLLDECDRIC